MQKNLVLKDIIFQVDFILYDFKETRDIIIINSPFTLYYFHSPWLKVFLALLL